MESIKIKNLADLVSLFMAFSIGYAILTQNWIVIIAIAALFTFNHVIKNITSDQRPLGANDCNTFNSGGKTKSFGMPSTHVSVFIAMLIFLEVHPVLVMIGFILMSWSRVTKECHTVPQTIVGGAWGLLYAICAKKILKINSLQ